ncbi:MAG: hypothetical protein DRP52_05005 [Planctomycetota bacterium]|nr:MAG: hypothetical protein DRP52_05005 [Planctomycetota bacterium]
MDSEGLLKNLTVHHKDWIDGHRIGDIANLLDSKGYAFDFVSDRMLEKIRYQNGELRAPGGTYKAVLVPKCTFMPAATLKRLGDLAGRGAKVIFEEDLPADVPGYGTLAKRRELFAAAKKHPGRFVIAKDALVALDNASVKRETLTDQGLRYIRRRTRESYWYFVANHTGGDFNGWLDLAVPFTSAILHDPMTGDSYSLPTQGKERKRRVYIDIAAGESFIIQAAQSTIKAKPYAPIKTTGQAFVLEGKWNIEFIEGGPELPKAYSTDSLGCWTNAPDEKAKVFAGTARYSLTFNLPHYAGADDYVLDLGDVRESARVRINGKKAAVLFAIPMRARVGQYLQKGVNTIEIEVTNLSANRIRDLEIRKVNWKIMHDANIVTPAYKSFDGSKWPIQPSGLLGPVRLTPIKLLHLT